jgi:hypothetical protein
MAWLMPVPRVVVEFQLPTFLSLLVSATFFILAPSVAGTPSLYCWEKSLTMNDDDTNLLSPERCEPYLCELEFS